MNKYYVNLSIMVEARSEEEALQFAKNGYGVIAEQFVERVDAFGPIEGIDEPFDTGLAMGE